MGTIVTAKCSCGFKREMLSLGGGMMNFKTVCDVPAVCIECGNFFTANYIEERNSLKCPMCNEKANFYNIPSLREKDTDLQPVFSWRISAQDFFELPDAKYYCPRCKKMKLRFIESGNWD